MKKYISTICLVLLGCGSQRVQDNPSQINSPDPTPTPIQVSSPDGGGGVDAGLDAGADSSIPPAPHCGDVGQDKCLMDESCRSHSDCASEACSYQGKCLPSSEKSCVNHNGGDTCGSGENEDPGAKHESCCKSLPVVGYVDPTHPGKTVWLDKYEVSAGRMRTFIEAVTAKYGKPDVKRWVAENRPEVWSDGWNQFLPSDASGGQITINRLLLGDPRHLGDPNPGPGIIEPPDTDQVVNLGTDYQFGGTIYTDLHGNNCQVYPGSFGFPTYYYPPSVLIHNGEVPRHDGTANDGTLILAKDALDQKAMNCSPNDMFQAFCVWDGGEMATSEVMDFLTESPPSLGNNSGCGIQIDFHGTILDPAHTLPDPDVRSGGRCPNLSVTNSTFDAGGKLPTVFIAGVESPDPLYNPGNFLNWNLYGYPNYAADITSEKVWQVSAPGRTPADLVHQLSNDEGWSDLAGNLSEAVLETQGGVFTGHFGLKFRGLGYGSARSDLNFSQMPDVPDQGVLRMQRPEVKSALVGSRCMRFK